MFEIPTLLILIPGLPLLACVLTAALGPWLLRRAAHVPTVAAIAGSFVLSLMLVAELRYQAKYAPGATDRNACGYQYVHRVWTWADIAGAYRHDPHVPGIIDESDVPPTARPLRIDITLRADSLTAIMLVTVTLISAIVAIYSIGYMHGDRGYWRFFTYFSLFVFSMTMLVSASNFVLLYVFWEAVGLCSYLLIGFWYEKPEAAAAGKKAFLVNRVGDFGFAIGLFLIWITYNTLNFHDVPGTPGVLGQELLSHPQRYVSGGVGVAIALMLLLGACGKSAQFPLHVWLPDAMEGPTPVSALIHAATMVTAGVYMVARCTPLFMAAPEAQTVVAVVGGFTALLAALIAMTQFDLKRVLAYSTVSQLGYMFLALGAGTFAGVTAGMFHLVTHAFFKALLFLGAGSVMHAMGNVIDMRRFGGLRHVMKITWLTFLIGALALAGVFPFAGFWSKDSILGAVHDRVHASGTSHAAGTSHGSGHAGDDESAGKKPEMAVSAVARPWVYWTETTHQRVLSSLYYIAMITAVLTAFYTFRAFFMTFYGPVIVPQEAGRHAHESPPVMWGPLLALAAGAAVVGMLLVFPSAWGLSNFLAQTPSLAYEVIASTRPVREVFHTEIAALTTLGAFVGIGLAAYFYLGRRREVQWLTRIMDFQWVLRVSRFEWLVQMGQTPTLRQMRKSADSVGLGWLVAAIGYLLLGVAYLLLTPLLVFQIASPYKLSLGKFFIDELYLILIVWPLEIAATISYWFDRWVIDGLVDACGQIPVLLGRGLRRLQMGLVQFYALAMVLGLLVLVAVTIIWGSR